MSDRGAFIVFEGGEGAGKTTQMSATAEHLRSLGHEVLTTREPGGTSIGEAIREILLDPANDRMTSRTEALLYAAARAQHASEVIRPALEEGSIVLCDRYIDSSVAYQGAGRGLGIEQIRDLSLWATDSLLPDLTVVLSLPVEDGFSRKDHQFDRLEREPMEFHRVVADAYAAAAANDPSRYVVIGADGSPEQVQQEVRTAVTGLLARLGA